MNRKRTTVRRGSPSLWRGNALPRNTETGAIAQLGERVLCKHEVVGSIPSGSTIILALLPFGLLERECCSPGGLNNEACLLREYRFAVIMVDHRLFLTSLKRRSFWSLECTVASRLHLSVLQGSVSHQNASLTAW